MNLKNGDDFKLAYTSGIAIAKLLISARAKNIILCDINGILVEGDNSLNYLQLKMEKITKTNLEKSIFLDAIKNADVFIGGFSWESSN